ncbi:glucan biosynthesis protein [Roseobacter sinensis]|uniref:Glucan biosynthesis protein n=1 Tax=Roseobacter sinensis TaxID=2931391 RepID=A0ABT3BJ92_9RHOB|nr:glucan biosynthesis protein [Roseobacter sp. WL0113]MCV3273637.1 glucan biosynthesis protein [Roseobacter sp. WL0113]
MLFGSAAVLTAGLWSGLKPESARADAPMTFEGLVEKAREAAARPFEPVSIPAPDLIAKIDYSAHWQIQFRKDATLYIGPNKSPVQFFHPGRYFPEPVRIHVRDAAGTAHEVPFVSDFFSIPEDNPALDLPEGFGFAGFRVMRPNLEPDWISFLGASYFRTDGPEAQYGLSARGIAINTGLNVPEEFPRFTAFWLGPPEKDDEELSIWAELDGPSITGAYRFGVIRNAPYGGHLTRVSAHLFLRETVERLGVAPLTSMYWYSERDRAGGEDWRPEIHDSDGLAMAAGSGERLWRPLSNPTGVTTSSFMDVNPAGFGLIQRDRDFENYQDDGVFYNRRPSAWIKPGGDWGPGRVQLILIPTDDETFDNVVAYWVPDSPTEKGASFQFDYEIEWRERDPLPQNVAWVVATRQGQGGVPGDPLPEGVAKMVVDFEGPSLTGLDRESGVVPVVDALNGRILKPIDAYPVVGTNYWRLTFDFEQTGPEPVSLRAYLKLRDRALTETWLMDAWVERGQG